MTLIRPALDYTARDFDSLRQRVFNVIPSAFPEWTDTQVADFGNLLVELFCYVGDVLGFYQDNQAGESRWSTAQLRRSILSLVKMIDYRPLGASAATATLNMYLAAAPLGTVTIRKGDKFSTLDTQNPVVFQAVADVVMAAGTTPPVAFVTVENSTSQVDLFLSTGLPSQEFQLAVSPFLEGSLTVVADDGSYLPVADFLDSSAVDRHAVVKIDENARATIIFGDGLAGSIPSGVLRMEYKTGGGSIGNVGSNTIKKMLSSYTDSFGNPVTARVTNLAMAGGGADRQTVESIRERGPRSLRAMTRTISREDYEINAKRVRGVARALMLTADELAGIPENTGRLYLVPEGGGFATQTLIDSVTDMITAKYPKGITFKPLILSASYLPVDVSAKIYIAKGSVPGVVAAAIKQAVAQFFAVTAADGSENNLVDFGYYLDGAIAWSDLFDVVRDTRGVRKVDDGLGNLTMNGESDDLTIPLYQFPQLRSIVVIDASTGAAL
jgi:hypothetical protein